MAKEAGHIWFESLRTISVNWVLSPAHKELLRVWDKEGLDWCPG